MNVLADTLVSTVERFSSFSATGRDEDFYRRTVNPHANLSRYKEVRLETIDHPPFLAISITARSWPRRAAARGPTSTGRCTPGGVIEGLYRAGVAMANPSARAVWAGTTLGPNMTFGYICGRTIAKEARDGAA
jgi:3-oxosteroid 1-dehydrogenase